MNCNSIYSLANPYHENYENDPSTRNEELIVRINHMDQMDSISVYKHFIARICDINKHFNTGLL